MMRRSAAAVACVATLGCSACSEPAPPGRAAGCGPGSVVVAVSGERSGRAESASNVWLVTADGAIRALTDDDRAFGPSLSDDGLTTAYLRNDGTMFADAPAMPTELWRRHVDGSDARLVAHARGFYEVALRPDGNAEAVVSLGAVLSAPPPPPATTPPDPPIHVTPSSAVPATVTPGDADRPLIWIVADDGFRALTPPPSDPLVRQMVPSWNPAGDKIAFVELVNGNAAPAPRIVVADVASGTVEAETAMPPGAAVVTDLRWDDEDTIHTLTRNRDETRSVVTFGSDLSLSGEDQLPGDDVYDVALAPGGTLVRVVEGSRSAVLELPTGRTVITDLVTIRRPTVARCASDSRPPPSSRGTR